MVWCWYGMNEGKQLYIRGQWVIGREGNWYIPSWHNPNPFISVTLYKYKYEYKYKYNSDNPFFHFHFNYTKCTAHVGPRYKTPRNITESRKS